MLRVLMRRLRTMLCWDMFLPWKGVLVERLYLGVWHCLRLAVVTGFPCVAVLDRPRGRDHRQPSRNKPERAQAPAHSRTRGRTHPTTQDPGDTGAPRFTWLMLSTSARSCCSAANRRPCRLATTLLSLSWLEMMPWSRMTCMQKRTGARCARARAWRERACVACACVCWRGVLGRWG